MPPFVFSPAGGKAAQLFHHRDERGGLAPWGKVSVRTERGFFAEQILNFFSFAELTRIIHKLEITMVHIKERQYTKSLINGRLRKK